MPPENVLPYKRSRFSTRLPIDRLYTPAHYWMAESEPGIWRVGFTKFASRMLGDLVERGFEAQPGNQVQIGQVIGWIEGFKAITDLYCVARGEFRGGNPALAADITLADTDPYGQGWLYAVAGDPGTNNLDAQGYAEVLNMTIDKMHEEAHSPASAGESADCPK